MLEEIKRHHAMAICPVQVRGKSIRDAAEAQNKVLLKDSRSVVGLVMEGGTTPEAEGLKEEGTEDEEELEKSKDSEAFVVGD